MYYVVALLVYAMVLMVAVFALRKPNDAEAFEFKIVMASEMIKGVTKSDVNSRKKRVKSLPLYQRVLYWVWFSSIMSFIFIPVIGLMIGRYYLIEYLFVPETAFLIDLDSPSLLVFGVGAFLVNIPFLVGYSWLTNRGIIREADLLYQLGSFEEYPARANQFIAMVLLIIGLPPLLLGFNSYRYLTPDHLVTKSALSILEKRYNYTDVDHVELRYYVDGDKRYTFVFKDGFSIPLSSVPSENETLALILEEHRFEIEIIYVEPLLSLK